MALPTTRDEFKTFCLKRLGQGAINIDVTDDQVEGCIDLALDYFRDFHYDGSFKSYFKYQVTETDRLNKYITLPENVFGAIRVFPIGQSITASDGLFNVQYQIMLNEVYTFSSFSMIPFYMSMTQVALMQQLLVGEIPMRFSRHRNRLDLDMNWAKITDGQWLLVEAYEVMDPATFTDVWSDRWLIKYTVAMIKQQWGNNLKKFSGVALIGGVQFNGQTIYEEATQEIAVLENDSLSSISLPVDFFIG